jgi:hypothetical protein
VITDLVVKQESQFAGVQKVVSSNPNCDFVSSLLTNVELIPFTFQAIQKVNLIPHFPVLKINENFCVLPE